MSDEDEIRYSVLLASGELIVVSAAFYTNDSGWLTFWTYPNVGPRKAALTVNTNQVVFFGEANDADAFDVDDEDAFDALSNLMSAAPGEDPDTGPYL